MKHYYFRTDTQKYPGAGYSVYHSGFETFYLMDKIIDPGFHLHRSCSQLSTHMMMQVQIKKNHIFFYLFSSAF